MNSNQRNQEISAFIRDKQKRSITVDSRWKSKALLLKHDITERFSAIYMCESNNAFFNDDLKYAAIYDNEKNQLFNMKWDFREMIEKIEFDINIQEINIEGLKEILLSEIKKDIQRYVMENSQDLVKEAMTAYQAQEPYHFHALKDNGIEYFLTHDCGFLKEDSCLQNQIKVTKGIYCNTSKLQDDPYWKTDTVILDYLADKVSTIEQESSKLLENQDFRISLGTNVLNSRFTADVICDILDNKNGEYDLLHKKEALIKALEEKDAVNVNLTITYGEDSLEFKFPKSRLLSSLKQADTYDISDYGKAYERVERFLREHKQDESNWHRDDFDFQNISRIMYSGKELYVDETLLSKSKKTRAKELVKER